MAISQTGAAAQRHWSSCSAAVLSHQPQTCGPQLPAAARSGVRLACAHLARKLQGAKLEVGAKGGAITRTKQRQQL